MTIINPIKVKITRLTSNINARPLLKRSSASILFAIPPKTDEHIAILD